MSNMAKTKRNPSLWILIILIAALVIVWFLLNSGPRTTPSSACIASAFNNHDVFFHNSSEFFQCQNPEYNNYTGNITVKLEQNTGTNWVTANFVYVPEG